MMKFLLQAVVFSFLIYENSSGLYGQTIDRFDPFPSLCNSVDSAVFSHLKKRITKQKMVTDIFGEKSDYLYRDTIFIARYFEMYKDEIFGISGSVLSINGFKYLNTLDAKSFDQTLKRYGAHARIRKKLTSKKIIKIAKKPIFRGALLAYSITSLSSVVIDDSNDFIFWYGTESDNEIGYRSTLFKESLLIPELNQVSDTLEILNISNEKKAVKSENNNFILVPKWIIYPIIFLSVLLIFLYLRKKKVLF